VQLLHRVLNVRRYGFGGLLNWKADVSLTAAQHHQMAALRHVGGFQFLAHTKRVPRSSHPASISLHSCVRRGSAYQLYLVEFAAKPLARFHEIELHLHLKPEPRVRTQSSFEPKGHLRLDSVAVA